MYECTNCKKRFGGEPFWFHVDESVFCSLSCYPEGTLDEPYAFAYAEMMEFYRECVDSAEYIETSEIRDALLNGINLYLQQCLSEALLDPEDFYYNGEIAKLHDLFQHLYDEVHDYFLDPETYLYFDGLDIYWGGLKQCVSEVFAVRLEHKLKQVLKDNGWKPLIINCRELDAVNEDIITMVFPDSPQDVNDELKTLFNEAIAFLMRELPEKDKDSIGDFISYSKLCECPICRAPEPYEDFSLNESYNFYACNYCADKYREA